MSDSDVCVSAQNQEVRHQQSTHLTPIITVYGVGTTILPIHSVAVIWWPVYPTRGVTAQSLETIYDTRPPDLVLTPGTGSSNVRS